MKNKKISIILSFVIALISIFTIQHPASVYADSNGLCVQFKYTHGTMGNQYAWSSSEGKSNAVCSKTGKAEKDDLFIEGSDDIVSFSLEGDTLKMKIWTLGTEATDSRACGGGQCPTERIYDTKEYFLGQYSSFDALSNAIIKDYSAHFPIEKKSNSTPVMVTEKITIPDDFTIKYGDMNIATPNNLTTEYGDEEGSDENDGEEQTCMNSGGAESLGWIVCPILTWMQGAAEGAYNNYVKPNLEVQPTLFQGSNNATQNAWGTFQGLANLCFVILFLIIIFSQLTGVGIDNYGIKKILPKLIVVAILVNLSYLICLICVDLSNILGNALQALFEGISPDVSSVTITNSDGAKAVGSTTITAIALLGLLFAVGAAVWQNPAILLTLLVAALGVLISIFFLFILLAARKAAIVVLTVISPVAFVCYMLPNTKKLFDKWLNFWEALLLLYPICGLLIGGGDFVSKLMLAAGSNTESDFFTAFTAMIVGIIPVFFIPTVLKSSFAALGSIGSKITGFGDRMRSGATSRLRNSERYRNAQERGQDRQKRLAAQRRAGVYIDGNGDIQTRRRPSARLRRRLADTEFGRRTGMDRTIGKNTTAFLQQEAARRNDVDGLNLDIAGVQLVKDANAREQRRAEATVGVAPISQQVAMQRAQASRNAQALKAFQDQYANFDKDALRADAANLSTLRGEPDGSQRVSALISAMESRGMEGEIYDMLRNDPTIHTDSTVMSALASSNNKVLKAYGKSGQTDFTSFMDGTGAGTMQGYIQGKGKEFLDGIDDKALAEIARHNNGGAIGEDLLIEAAAKLNNADSLRQVNDMISHRVDSGNSFNISGDQLSKFDDNTVIRLLANNNGREALLRASDNLSPQLAGKLDATARIRINTLRSGRKDGGNTAPI